MDSSSSLLSKGMIDDGNESHVLAVDDNVIDRKLVENCSRSPRAKGFIQ
ncbi:hypothetical protein Acr_02g0002770 [Actinidia rufa]|uniref:Uncharacterized protein n=1 Tax=Actinidia rufa TaxID=165716 RepID=A0A7J0E8N5_9ERIC|nr:hypothetical protein Acr_02g0002770 [Actinidia rufa]